MSAVTTAFNAVAQRPAPEAADVQAFMNAAFDGDSAGIEGFLDKFGAAQIAVTRGEPLAWTALFWAAQSGNAASLGLLLERGAAIDQRDASGATPLMVAARQGKKDAAVLLLARGADPGAADAEGKTALACAKGAANNDVAALLENALAARQEIRAEAARRDAEAAQAALDAVTLAARSFQDGMRRTAKTARFRVKPGGRQGTNGRGGKGGSPS